MNYNLEIKIESVKYSELESGDLYSWYPASYWHTRDWSDDMELKVKGSAKITNDKYLKNHLEQKGNLSATKITFIRQKKK